MKKIIALIGIFVMFCTVSYAGVDVPENVRIKLNNGSIIELGLDEYLYGVVLAEMGTSYKVNGKTKLVDIEALKAQAVAARTYAVYNINRSKNEDFDLTVTTNDQVYKDGCSDAKIIEAVDSTSGQVITYNGEIICAYFYSASGGRTEVPENVWFSSLPYLKSVDDPYEPYIDGRTEWVARIPADKYGKIEILERNENGRVQKLKIGDEIYSKNNIRIKLGTLLIKSTWFDVSYDKNTDEYVFSGRGNGHGVGMSQYGAMGMAEAGFNYQEILKWYYNDIELEPNGDKYIVIDKDKNSDEDDLVTKKDNDYSNSKTEINDTSKEDTKGPLLKKILDVVDSINSWR